MHSLSQDSRRPGHNSNPTYLDNSRKSAASAIGRLLGYFAVNTYACGEGSMCTFGLEE